MKFYVRFSTFPGLHFRTFTVAINPIPVKILSRESANVFGTAADGILGTPSCFFADSQVYSPTCLSTEEGSDQ
jgi:hypothetical protein